MMKYNNEISSLIKSFQFAFRGIWFCVKNERNMRIHFVFAFFTFVFSLIYKLQAYEYAILALTIGFVIVAEMVNTAIETMVNLESPAYNPFARIAKDVAAGAVLMSAIVAIIVGFLFFLKDPQKLWNTFCWIVSTPYALIPIMIALLLGMLFIFRGTKMFSIRERVRIYKIKQKKRNDIKYTAMDDTEVKIYELKKDNKK